MADMKSSKDKLSQAVNNMDPNLQKIAANTDAIVSTLSQQSSAIQQLKDAIARKEQTENEGNKQITSSLKQTNSTISLINKNILNLNKNVTSLTKTVSSLNESRGTTVSLLCGIQTSLIQITSVLASFRSDYLLSTNGQRINGNSFYDMTSLNNLVNSLSSLKDPTVKQNIQALHKALKYANSSSKSVRSHLGQNVTNEDSIFEKILGIADTGKQYAGLGALFSPYIKGGKFNSVIDRYMNADTSSIANLFYSMLGSNGKKTIKDIKGLGSKFSDSNNPLKRLIGNMMGQAGFKNEKKEREKDPTLVLSSLAPFADDIKDMVNLSYQGVKSRPKSIPIYAKPVWIVNSPDQKNYVGNVKAKDTHGADLKRKRLEDLFGGRANNLKDIYGNELLYQDEDGHWKGSATEGFNNKQIRNIRQKQESRNRKLMYGENYKELENKIYGSKILNTGIGIGNFKLSLNDLLSEDPNNVMGNMISNLAANGLQQIPGLLGSHAGGKKGKKRRKGLDPNREINTNDHDVSLIDGETTVLNASQTDNLKDMGDIKSGITTMSGAIASLASIISQSTILFSQAASSKKQKIDSKVLNKLSPDESVFDYLLKTSGSDEGSKKALTQFKKFSNLKKTLKITSKRETTSEYFGLNPNEGNGKKGVLSGAIDSLTTKLGVNKDLVKDPKRFIKNSIIRKVNNTFSLKGTSSNGTADKIAEGVSDDKNKKKIKGLFKSFKKQQDLEIKDKIKEGTTGLKDVAKVSATNETVTNSINTAETAAVEANIKADAATNASINKMKMANAKQEEATKAAADKTEVAQQIATDKFVNATEVKTAAQEAMVQEASVGAEAGASTTSFLGKITATMCGLPLPVKIGLGAAGVAATVAIGKKMYDKVKQAANGKKPNFEDSQSSLKGASGKTEKEAQKEKEKAEKAQKRQERLENFKKRAKRSLKSSFNALTLGLFAQKVYVADNGDVLYSKDNSPVKKLDKHGNETEETLNVKDTSGKVQLANRLAAREFKLDKVKTAKFIASKVKDGVSKLKDKIKEKAEQVKSWAGKHKGEIAAFAVGGIAGVGAYEVAKGAYKGVKTLKENKYEKINQMLTVASTPFLFMDNKMKKSIEKLQNSKIGKQMLNQPMKAAKTLFQTATYSIFGSSETAAEKSGLKSLLTNITKKLTGEDDHKDKFTSNLEDIGEESATVAYSKLNENNLRNRILNAFAKATGIATAKKGDNGHVMTTSQIVDEERTKNASLQIAANGTAGNASGANMSGTWNSAAQMINGPTKGQTVQDYVLKTLQNSSISRGVSDGHRGVDFAAAMNTPIYSPFEGKVVASAYDPDRIICTNNAGGNDENGSMGNFVLMQLPNGNYATFMHMVEGPAVRTGELVKAGQLLGKVGNTGGSYGAHLHLEIKSGMWGGTVLDPASYGLGRKGKKLDGFDKNKKTTGYGAHVYQRDYSNIIFNKNGDETLQTLGDSGCGPAAATVVKRLYTNGKSRFGRADNKNKDNKDKSTAKASTVQNPLGKTASFSDDYGNTFDITIEQEHIDVFNACKECGCSDAAACGVLGNLHQETGGTGERLRHWAENHGEYGGGIMQWTPWTKHVDWANSHGMNPWTWEASLAHMQDELLNGGNWSNPQDASPSLASEGYHACSNTPEFMALNDPADAAVNFERAFEVSGDWNGRNSEGIVYSENQLRDRKRVGPAIAYYECLVGTYNGSVRLRSSVNGVSGSTGFINIITDSVVSGSQLANYMNANKSTNNSTTDITASNGSTATTGNGRFGRGVSFGNIHFESTSSPNNNNNSIQSNITKTAAVAPSVGSYIKNNMSITDTDDKGNSKTTTSVYTTDNKTTLTTNGKSTIVICNNFTEKTKTDLSEILSNFKKLNGTQANALKVLKAISDLIKEENSEALESLSNLKLSNDGLDYILKGL